MKKLQRFLTALMTLLFMAPSYSAMGADMPDDFYIVGHVQKGAQNSDWSTCLQYTSKDEAKKRFVFDISITNIYNGGGSFAFRQDEVNGGNCQFGENYYRPSGKNSGQDETAALNGTYPMDRWNSSTQKGPGWFLTSGNYRLVVDFSGDAPVLKVLAENAEINDPEPPAVPEQLYIIGHIENGGWNNGRMGTKKGDTFVFEGIRFVGYGGNESTFGFSTTTRQDLPYYGNPTGDNEPTYTGSNSMKLVNSGGWKVYGTENKYDITVYFTNPASPYFTITEQEEPIEAGIVPEKFYIFGNIEGKNGWNGDGTPLAFTSRDAEAGIITFSEVQLDGSFAFCSEEGQNGDDCKNHDGYLGSNASEGDVEIGSGETGLLYSKTGHGYIAKDKGVYDIVVYFPATGDPYFKLNKIVEWYFVGDLNEWFSNEFDAPEYDENGNLKNKGINPDRFNATKKNWRFVPADDPVLAAEGWYMFNNFPMVDGYPTLSGQFKIKDGIADWSGNEYVHPVDVGYANDDNFKNYNAGTLLEENIGSGKPFPGKVLVKKAGNINGSGGNLHFQCNAVRDAVVYFNPNLNGQAALRIDGDPVDYFIFYCRGEEGQEDDAVRGRVVEGKPNSNNYYLPGTTGDGVTLSNPAGGEHMNIGDGKTFHKIDLTKSADDILAQFAEAFPTAYPNSTVNQAMFKDIAEKKKLPNGVVIDDRKFIYVEKVPNGFASPAGVHFSMLLNKALDTESKKVPTILSTKHIYYLNAYTPVHVHVNYDGMKDAYSGYGDPKVSYRVYYTKSYQPAGQANTYGRYVVNNVDYWPSAQDENEYASENKELDHLISWGSNLPLTKNDPVGNQIGWVELNDYKDQSLWGATEADHNHPGITMWNVNWGNRRDVETAQSVAAYAANDIDDQRLRLRSRYSTAYVQFRVEIPHETDPSKTIVNYFPPKLDIEQDSEHYPIGGKDLYVVMDNKDGVWTGVDDIEIDYWYDGEEAEDNSAPVFYNLQGTKVANPSNGIFIMVKGGKSKKVFIK